MCWQNKTYRQCVYSSFPHLKLLELPILNATHLFYNLLYLFYAKELGFV